MSKGKQPRTRVKVPKLLLSEIKKVFIISRQGDGLRSSHNFKILVTERLLNFKSIENLTDLNNIPKPCPYKINIIVILWGSRTLN